MKQWRTSARPYLCAALVFALCAAMADSPRDPVEAPSEIISDIAELRGPTLPTQDLDASTAFFTTVLGLKANEKIVYNSPLMRAVAGAPAGPDIYVVALRDRVKDFALLLVSAEGLEIDSGSNAINAATLSWRLKDVDAAYERAIAAGYDVL